MISKIATRAFYYKTIIIKIRRCANLFIFCLPALNIQAQISSDELIVRTDPQDKETNVAQIRNYQFKIEFSESMDKNSVINGITFSRDMYHKYEINYYPPFWDGNTVYFGYSQYPVRPNDDVHFDYIMSPFINTALKPNATYTITLDTTVKTTAGKTLKKNYSLSFTISQAKYNYSNIKEYAVQLFKSQFGINLCSPFIAPVYATSTNGRICDYWIAIAYLDKYPLRLFITEDGSFLRDYKFQHYPYLSDPERIVYIEPKGIKKILNVFLDYGNSDISQVYDKYWSHSQDSINNEYTKYFKSWGIKDTVLYFKNTNICINAALVGNDAYAYSNLYPYLKSNGYDVNSYDLIIIMNMNPGSEICCAWQVSTLPGEGPFSLVCHDFRHQTENFANYTQADLNLYARTIYYEEMQHAFGYEHSMPLRFFYNSMAPEVAHLHGKPDMFVMPGIFGWDDTDGNGIIEILEPNPFGLNCIPSIKSNFENVCQGTSNATYSTECAMTGYTWNISDGGTIISGTDSSTITVQWNTAGAKTVEVNYINLDGIRSSTILKNVVVKPLPLNAETISGLSSVCLGQNPVLYTIPVITNATSYVWTLPGGATGTNLNNTIRVNYSPLAVSGNIQVKGKNACGEGESSNLAITVKELPQRPSISLNGNILHSDALIGNQWYNQNGLIEGETNQDYYVAVDGSYYVIAQLDCNSYPSNTIDVIVSDIKIVGNDRILKVYPNPVTDELLIEIEGYNEVLNFQILNAIGQVIFNGNFVGRSTVQTSNFAPGIYLIKLENGSTFELNKVIKQ